MESICSKAALNNIVIGILKPCAISCRRLMRLYSLDLRQEAITMFGSYNVVVKLPRVRHNLVKKHGDSVSARWLAVWLRKRSPT